MYFRRPNRTEQDSAVIASPARGRSDAVLRESQTRTNPKIIRGRSLRAIQDLVSHHLSMHFQALLFLGVLLA